MRLDHITLKQIELLIGKRQNNCLVVIPKFGFKELVFLDPTSLPGGNRVLVPPDPISNSEVKRHIADGSVGSPHVRVGHCQASITKAS